MLNEEKLKKIQEYAELVKKSITHDEFVDAFKKVLDFVKQAKEAGATELQAALRKIETAIADMEKYYRAAVSEIDEKITAKSNKQLSKLTEEQRNGLNYLYDKIRNLKNGKDADEDKIIDAVLAQIKLPEYKETVLDTPEQIADKLESLDENKKLKIEAVKGLSELLEELKKRPTRLGGGGGFSLMAWQQHVIDNETPTETPNGVLTNFTLVNTPSPANSLKVFVNGQRMKLTDDYTLSGNTISFLTAPPTGSLILCDYKI